MEQTNRHHLAFPRYAYKTRLERDFRQHRLMIVRMDVEGHKELHAHVNQPPKLRQQEMLGAIGLLNEMIGEQFTDDQVITYLAHHLEGRSDRANRLAINLHQQAGYVALYGVHHDLTRD